MNAIISAISHSGGPQALANALGVSIQRVVNWRNRGRVPAAWAARIEAATHGAVTRHDLRPDIYPHPDDGLPPVLRGREAA